jgi:phage terminase small subunit
MTLTPKQEAFCLAYLETGNASEAYRRAYSAAGMKAATINVKASELLSNGKVAVRLDELRKPAVKAAQMTLEGHLADLKMLRDKALEAEQYSAAITAETNRGKAAGLYTEKVDLTSSDGSMSAIPTRIEIVAPSMATKDE